MDKNEIEIEEIDLDAEKFDISIDIGQFDEMIPSSFKSGIASEELSADIEGTSTESEKINKEETYLGSEEFKSDIVENNISLSDEELDNLLSGVEIKETMESSPPEEPKENQVTIEEGVTETLVGKLEEADFSKASEAVREESEVINKGIEDLGDIVIMSDQQYNKIIEEKEVPEIVEKPEIEEDFGVKMEEEILKEEPIEPSSLLGEDLEIKEFEEIGIEDITISSKEPDEVSINAEGEKIERIISELPLEVSDELKEETPKNFEVIDDFKIENGIVKEIKLEEEQVSITPDELGVEEISIPKVSASVSKEEITSIGLFDEKKITEEEHISTLPKEEAEIDTLETTVSLETFTEKLPIESKTRAEILEATVQELGEEEKENVIKILKYLDKLLENLPEEKIKEFASSEYYDLYVRLFDKLNIK